MKIGKNATIYDIAKEAGVSIATVSRVLTGNAKVKQEKKERIEELIKQYDYKPSALARGLRETKSKVLGMIVADIRNPFYSTLFVECEKAARREGYTIIVSNTYGDSELEDIYLDEMYEQRVDAIIKVGGRVDELVSNQEFVDHVNRIANTIPVIITGKLDGADCYQVNIDEMLSAELVIEYLVSLGHKKIALIGGCAHVKSTVDKRFRYKQLLKRFGIEVKEDYIVEGKGYDDESGYACMMELFHLPELPTAIIAINDFTAVGAIRAITDMGILIPDEISVASFDNTFITEVSIPKLTSVSYNYEKFGQTIVDVAVNVIKGENVDRIITVAPKLIVRDSCKDIRNDIKKK